MAPTTYIGLSASIFFDVFKAVSNNFSPFLFSILKNRRCLCYSSELIVTYFPSYSKRQKLNLSPYEQLCGVKIHSFKGSSIHLQTYCQCLPFCICNYKYVWILLSDIFYGLVQYLPTMKPDTFIEKQCSVYMLRIGCCRINYLLIEFKYRIIITIILIITFVKKNSEFGEISV